MDEKVDPKTMTVALQAASKGDRKALDAALPAIYAELKAIARRQMQNENAGHTLQATALVNEAYFKLCDARNLDVTDRNRFYAAAANIMRRILIDHARGGDRQKRKAPGERVTLSGVEVVEGKSQIDLIALNDALEALEKLDKRAAGVVELRFFGGLSIKEAAEVLGVAERTVNDDWVFARAWLHRELSNKKA